MVFRYARHTQNIENLVSFYTEILGFKKLGSFENHKGYNGVFLGLVGENWHLEFTKDGCFPQSKFDEDDALVFYPSSMEEYNRILSQIEKSNIIFENPKNPYWKTNGKVIKDPDGFWVIISSLKIISQDF